MAIPDPTPGPSAADGVTTLTARTPEDLLALAPVLLGFWPEESIVMLTVGAQRPFHARLGLPPSAEQTPATLREVEEVLLTPARDHGARRLVLLYFTADRRAAEGVHRVLRRGCRRARVGLVTALHADGRCWSELSHPDPAARAHTRSYDVSCHPFVVQALVDGRLAHRTREEMVASLEPDPAAVDAVCAALAAAQHVDAGIPSDARAIREAGRWVTSLVSSMVTAGGTPSDDEVARLIWVMQCRRVRDAAWSLIRREDATAHLRFWQGVVQRTPDRLAAPPAALLGWAAWQAGDGARAWAAVDRCHRAEPSYPLAGYLGTLLQHAVPPDHWQGGFDWESGLSD
ncbi:MULTISPECIES: DUF4192 domain-containing protein [Nocardioides]|uniref:DUF4192 domain-containing protein n=1 Tax=Nocardioides vastitatis TaxID=2568655 RepID=A0ABW0ZGP4_9ACTN|nr:DUF4192 domain-containing protein [Nocardioides sp.]